MTPRHPHNIIGLVIEQWVGTNRKRRHICKEFGVCYKTAARWVAMYHTEPDIVGQVLVRESKV